jgi:hypothetical protein
VRAFNALLVAVVVGLAHLAYAAFFLLDPVHKVHRWLKGHERMTHHTVYSLMLLSAATTTLCGLCCIQTYRFCAPDLHRELLARDEGTHV